MDDIFARLGCLCPISDANVYIVTHVQDKLKFTVLAHKSNFKVCVSSHLNLAFLGTESGRKVVRTMEAKAGIAGLQPAQVLLDNVAAATWGHSGPSNRRGWRGDPD